MLAVVRFCGRRPSSSRVKRSAAHMTSRMAISEALPEGTSTHSIIARQGHAVTQLLSERQQTARALAREIEAAGAWVTSALPLDDQQRLRLQILDSDRNRVAQQIRDLGFEPMFVSILPRVHPTGLLAACIYEIDLPRRRRRKKVREYSRPGTAIRVKWPFKLSNIGSNWSCGP